MGKIIVFLSLFFFSFFHQDYVFLNMLALGFGIQIIWKSILYFTMFICMDPKNAVKLFLNTYRIYPCIMRACV